MNSDFTTVNEKKKKIGSKTGPFFLLDKKPRYFFVSTSGGTDLMIRLYMLSVRNERESRNGKVKKSILVNEMQIGLKGDWKKSRLLYANARVRFIF